jgi:hypothetical protein
MKFHTFEVISDSEEWDREDWESPFPDLTEKVASGFQRLLVSKTKIYKPFPGLDVTMEWWKGNGEKTVAAYNMHSSDWTFGAGTLMLAGGDAQEEKDFCQHWQRSIYRPEWKLPIPALEIENRPLFYTILYAFKKDLQKDWQKEWLGWYKIARNYMNAIGLAFIRSVQ